MDYILMDLDGTITNPKQGITKSVQYALKAMGIIIEDLDSLTKHIGPPLKDGFLEDYGFTEEEADRAVEKYREFYMAHGIFDNEPYEGIDRLLAGWKAAGKSIIVATSKPEPLARRILEHFGLEVYFTDICGATFDDQRSRKAEVIRYALEKNGISDLARVVMVGDRKYDTAGAKEVGIASVGVLYGFGSREELTEAGADRIVETVEELYKVVLEL
jgi:phosphoglycolate phosphatase